MMPPEAILLLSSQLRDVFGNHPRQVILQNKCIYFEVIARYQVYESLPRKTKILTWMTLGEGTIFFFPLYPGVSDIVQISKNCPWKPLCASGWGAGMCIFKTQVTGGPVSQVLYSLQVGSWVKLLHIAIVLT